MRSKIANLNSLFEIKLHKVTWLFFLKDLLSRVYNLIHVRNVETSSSSLVDPLTTTKERWYSIQYSKNNP